MIGDEIGLGEKSLSQRVALNATIPAKYIIRTTDTLNGQDDVRVQDFILNVKCAVSKCSQPDLLLDRIESE